MNIPFLIILIIEIFVYTPNQNIIITNDVSLSTHLTKSNQTTYELIKQAILNKNSVTCYYHGYLRKMSPHVLGTKGYRKQCLFYQYGGDSGSGLSSDPDRNWRCMFIDEIQNLKINNDEFHTSDNHSHRETCVDNVDVEIEY